jgi:hypothetical protein
MHHKLHQLDATKRIKFRLGVTIVKSVHDLAPRCMADLCKPVTTSAGRGQLRSAASGISGKRNVMHQMCEVGDVWHVSVRCGGAIVLEYLVTLFTKSDSNICRHLNSILVCELLTVIECNRHCSISAL